jgi:hypothetical protein
LGGRTVGKNNGGEDGADGRIFFAPFFANAAVMQVAPSEMLECSLWEWAAMVDGWNKANSSEESDPLKPEEEDELEHFISQPSVWMN